MQPALLAGFLLPLACGGAAGPIQVPGAQGEFLRAREAYEGGRHLEAIELLEAFERRHPGSQFIDDALFYLGKAHQANREQLLARQTFVRLIETFPRSTYTEDAFFEIAHSSFREMRGPALDPEPAEEALRALYAYQARYPNGEHMVAAAEAVAEVLETLARKAYLNGRTYLRLGRPEAARRYLRKSIEVLPTSPVSAKVYAMIARSYEREKRWAEAREVYQQLLDHLGTMPQRYEDGEDLAARARSKLDSLPR